MRIFHRITTRSDLQHACGKVLKTAILLNKREDESKTMSEMAHRWPIQGTPTVSDVINWSLVIEETYGVKKEHPIFPEYLRGGRWRKQSQLYQQWCYIQLKDCLYQREDTNKWRIWECRQGRTRRQTNTFHRTDHVEEEVVNAIPASVIKTEEYTIVMVSTGEYEIENNNQQDVSDELENSTDWLLQRVSLPKDGGKKFCKQVQNHKAMTCGDGSYKQGKATGGSLSFDKDSLQVGIRIDNEIPIDHAGELGGIGGIIAATNALCKSFHIREGTITHGVDNDAALSNRFGPFELTTLTPCFHIVKQIQATIKKSPIKWIGKKVKAHQDKHSEIEQLDCWVKANILADKQAKAHL